MMHIAVKAIILNANQQVLILQRNTSDDIDANLWDLPGGRVGPNEEKEAALIREVEEETGLAVKVVSLFNTWQYRANSDTHLLGFTYLCHAENCSSVVLSPEHSAFKWIKPADIDAYAANESLKEEVRRVAR